MEPDRPRVLIGAGRSGQDSGILAGCRRYVEQHGLAWELVVSSRAHSDLGLAAIDAAIGFANSAIARRLSARSAVPKVTIGTDLRAGGRTSVVCPDNEAVGQLVTEFARSQRYAMIALIGAWAERRARFAPVVAASQRSGLPVSRYEQRQADFADPIDKEAHLADWLQQQPRPVLAFCAQDKEARWLLELCSRYALAVPEACSVLGVDDDVWLCECQRPTLSSVHIPWQLVGFQAALELHRLLSGAPARIHRIRPLRITERQSTRSEPVEDPLVLAIMAELREHIAERPRLGDLPLRYNCSRQTIHRRFRAALGMTTETWWLAERLAVARRLLERRGTSIASVAQRSGFASTDALRQAFVSRFGLPPSLYRRVVGDGSGR